MINLEVAEYCQDCPGFEAEVDKYRVEGGSDEGVHVTTVSCTYSRRCASMVKYLKKQSMKAGESND